MPENGSQAMIRVRGAAVHNLQHVDVDLPHGQLIAFCGVSGSGKTSLALDTLYAEGQRRYIECFSNYTRQFLEQLDKPTVDRIEGIPPAIAVTRKSISRSSRATVGSAAQINDHLQLLFARIGETYCLGCGQLVRRDTPDSAAETVSRLSPGIRLMIGFATEPRADQTRDEFVRELIGLGYRRAIWDKNLVDLDGALAARFDGEQLDVVVDRLTSGTPIERVRESLEKSLDAGANGAVLWIEQKEGGEGPGVPEEDLPSFDRRKLADHWWLRRSYSRRLRCEKCRRQYADPVPQHFNFNSPLGACPACEGFGNLVDVDMNLVVPEPRKSLREGAIAPWNTPAYEHELHELLALAPDFEIPVDAPFENLSSESLRVIHEGVPERKFGGLNGFFAWLERRKYKVHIRVFLSRWRSYSPCPKCRGSRFQEASLAVRVGGKNVAEAAAMKIRDARVWLGAAEFSPWQRQVSRLLVEQVARRLAFLDDVGVGHLTLDRSLRTLSAGEVQRVALTSALGSNLTGLLYVLDEPAAGLHPADVPPLVRAVRHLCARGNTVALIEHEASLIEAADQVVELGPGAGELGGKIIFQGSPSELLESPHSRTGDWLSGRRGHLKQDHQRRPGHGTLRLLGARGNNLRHCNVEFPLGVLCLVTGVSGSGKTTLVQQTLFGAVARKLRIDADPPLPHDDLLGVGQLDDAVLVDQSPIGRTPRSNPITYVKAFDPIRALFAETIEAQSRGFKAGHFSFNVEGGRCEACEGEGFRLIDMQFMADVYMSCAECHGTRYRREVLEVKYRGLSVAEVLDLSVREAFTFFRGQKKIQARLHCLIDVGLEYLRLGQPANTLSSGEAQRLKLANFVSSARRGRTLFVLDEPTAGLHHADVVQLIDCLDSLLSMGHSLVIADHHPLLVTAADHIIDLGPGAADDGGLVVATGTPEAIACHPASITGKFIAAQIAAQQRARVATGEQALSEQAAGAAIIPPEGAIHVDR